VSAARVLRLVAVAMLGAAMMMVAPPAAVASPGIQTVTLHIINLKCLFQNDTFGSDEPYLVVNGARIWSGSNVDDGDTESIEYWTGFDGVIQIDLWEDDGGLTGRDDHMAVWFIFDSEIGTGVHKVQSPWGVGPALYDMWYEVV